MPGPPDDSPPDHPEPPHEHERASRDDHAPEHPSPPGAVWIENDRRRRPLTAIADILRAVGTELQETGSTSIRETEITPSEECTFTARYERTAEGELRLSYELEWQPSEGVARDGAHADPFQDRLNHVKSSDTDGHDS